DNANAIGTKSFSITINAAPLTITTPAALPSGSVDQPYSQTLQASGGTAPYSFAVAGSGLPTGLGLSSAGVLSGSPKLAGNYAFSVVATDSTSATANKQFTLQVNASPIVI